MSVRHLLAAAAVAVLLGFGLATPAAAHVLDQPGDVGAYTLTAGRVWSLAAALPALVGVALGGLALARSTGRIGTGNGTRGAVVALAVGLVAMVIGALVVAAAKGGPGTGYGIVGGYLDLAVGLVAMVLGGLALARSRRSRRAG
ncbi:DUF6223 family protein [Sphaerimonospora cavernae]|uniref:DUF6223 family protein n=1 Tax=Sphaerimonospora cavernae TaxID=1740611 RepID=A0ABV6U431_9ACTN